MNNNFLSGETYYDIMNTKFRDQNFNFRATIVNSLA